MKIYTKTGDQGQTSLLSGARISKANIRLQAFGDLDELNSHLGVLIYLLQREASRVEDELIKIQHNLFNLGSQVACDVESYRSRLPDVSHEATQSLEKSIDQMESALPALKNFILPGGSQLACQAHVCRTVSRRAERSLSLWSETDPEARLSDNNLAFINRLSDYFFVLSRFFNQSLGVKDVVWNPPK